ncbi:MAG: histidine phosphatase family protein [Ilumatobacteraceae bacterium]|nr:histidine phosphatase family protein [Ilumatobacteraceae bacterium]
MTTTSTVYLVRHAKAGDRSSWNGNDRVRPLTGKGRRQAVKVCDRLFPLVSIHSAALLISSPYTRCLQTLEPLAARLHSTVSGDDRLAEGYDRDGALGLIASVPNGSVLCSHGDVIPDVMAALQRRTTEIIGAPDWRKGSVWVLARHGDEVVEASCWAPPTDD